MKHREKHIMDTEEYSSFYKFIGRDIDNSQVKDVLGSLPKRHYEKGQIFVRQGDPGSELFLIQAGSAAVFVKGNKSYVNLLRKDDYFGELALLANEPRKATVVAAEPLDVFVIGKKYYNQLVNQFPFLTMSFMEKLYKRQMTDFLLIQNKNKQLEESIRMRKVTTHFLTLVLVALSIYSFGMVFADEVFHTGSRSGAASNYITTRVVELFTLLLLLIVGKKIGFTLTDFGFTLKGSKRSILESIGISAGIMLLLTGAKVLLIRMGFTVYGSTVFPGIDNISFTFYFYLVVAVLQEFIARGMFQSTLQRLMVDKTNGLSAIALCSLIFAVLHLHISISYALISMLFSFIWGLMYKRHKTIAGTSLSHFLIGNMGRLLGV